MMTLQNIDPKEFEDFKVSSQNEIQEYQEMLEDYRSVGATLKGFAKRVFQENVQDIEAGILKMQELLSFLPETVYIN